MTIKDFYKRKSRPKGISSACKICEKERLIEYIKKNPAKRKRAVNNWKKKQPREKFRIYERRNYDRLAKIIRDAKNVPCADCGIKYPSYVMDFDHRDPSTKIACVSKLANSNSAKKLMLEIAKCDVVCANCHRIRTYSSKLKSLE